MGWLAPWVGWVADGCEVACADWRALGCCVARAGVVAWDGWVACVGAGAWVDVDGAAGADHRFTL